MRYKDILDLENNIRRLEGIVTNPNKPSSERLAALQELKLLRSPRAKFKSTDKIIPHGKNDDIYTKSPFQRHRVRIESTEDMPELDKSIIEKVVKKGTRISSALLN